MTDILGTDNRPVIVPDSFGRLLDNGRNRSRRDIPRAFVNFISFFTRNISMLLGIACNRLDFVADVLETLAIASF